MSDDNDNDPPLPTLEECEGVVTALAIGINFLKRERLRSSMAEQQFCKLPVAGSSPAVGFLTADEREAFAWGINWLFARFIMDDNPTARRDIKTLQQLFARLDVTNPRPIEISAEVSSHPKSDRIYVSSQDSID